MIVPPRESARWDAIWGAPSPSTVANEEAASSHMLAAAGRGED
jgi:hypothetical protein